jgi:SagB-type dehydrogenase family enzyme
MDSDIPPDDAPAFAQFWLRSSLNPTRGVLMRERIDRDAVHPFQAPRLSLPQAAKALPSPSRAVRANWANRRSERAFGPLAIKLSALSDVLWPLSERVTGGRQLASGGAKYPLLTYVITLSVRDMPPSLCWYDPQAHGMVPIGAAPAWPVLAQALGVDWPAPPVIVVVTARPQGMLAKYGERGGRFTALEAGSYMGALQVETARAGLCGVPIGSFYDRQLLDLLQTPLSTDLAMFAYALGYPAVS